MRLAAVAAALTLLALLALPHHRPGAATDALESAASHASAASGPCLFAAADRSDSGSAFDDDDDAPVPIASGDDEEPPRQQPTRTQQKTNQRAQARPPVGDEDDDVAELLQDDDEFVGGAPDQPSRQVTPKNRRPASSAAPNDPNEPTIGNVIHNPSGFLQPIGWPEYIGVLCIVLYIVNYFVGSRANGRIAADFAQHFRSVFEEQFAYIGTDAAPVSGASSGSDASSGSSGFRLEKQSEHSYQVYASGRRFCSGLLLTLNLRPRQDLLSLLLSLVDLAPTEDTCVVEVALNEDEVDQFSFALAAKKHAKKFAKEFDAAGLLAPSKSTRAGLEGAYAVLTELAELEGELINDRVAKLLQRAAVQRLFVSAYFTDQLPLPWSSSKRVLRFQFRLPATYDASSAESDESPSGALRLLLQSVFYWIDRLPLTSPDGLRLTPGQRAKVEARRKKLLAEASKAEAKERAEQALQKKAEQRKKEQEIIARDPNSELAKELIRKQEHRAAKQAKKMKGGNIKIMR